MSESQPAELLQEVARSYDAIAPAYADRYVDELSHKPLDRALLNVLAEIAGPGRTIADVGCGPGHVAAFLHDLGARAIGVDLSPQMVEIARARFGGVEYQVASMLELPAGENAWDGIVALYSIIHLEAGQLPLAFAEFHRVLRAGAPLLLAFHVGDEVRHAEEMFERPVSLDFHFLQISDVTRQLESAGFHVTMTLERTAYAPHEVDTRRGYVMASAR